jgi:beta-lactamase superfamily II metal-dependent hydrolase
VGYEIDFLAVGEGERGGDAIALRFGNLFGARSEQTVIVIDGGWSDTGKELAALIREHFRTDTVDLVISTHPDDDHSNGLLVLLDELTVRQLAMHLPWDHTQDIARMFSDGRVTDWSVRENLRRSLDSACALSKLAKRKNIPIVEPFAGVSGFGGAVQILGPSREYYESLLPHFRGTPEPKAAAFNPFMPIQRAGRGLLDLAARAAESIGIETLTDLGVTSPENNSSVITLVRVDGRGLLFTGDAGIEALTHAADQLAGLALDHNSIHFIQVPHHGSRRNVGPTILNRLVGPKLLQDTKTKTAFCSCPKDSEKHPARKTTNAFRRRGAPVYVTKGTSIWHHYEAPNRAAYNAIDPIQFFTEVEDD